MTTQNISVRMPKELVIAIDLWKKENLEVPVSRSTVINHLLMTVLEKEVQKVLIASECSERG